MNKPIGVEDISKSDLIKLLSFVQKAFQSFFIRTSDESTSVYFYNARNTTNTYINIDNKLLAEYNIDLLNTFSPDSGSGS